MRSDIKLLTGTAAIALAVAAPAHAQFGYGNDRISLSGTVAEASDEDSFVLDYGQGTIEVESDDIFDFNDEFQVNEGERVIVYGEADYDLFEGRVIEADQVYSMTSAIYYVDAETDVTDPVSLPTGGFTMEDGTYATFTGTVRDISNREFTLDTGENEISVDTLSMSSNPLDDRGRQQIDEGDTVIVSGTVDDALFDEQELSAMVITSLPGEQANANNRSNRNDRSQSMRNERNSDRNNDRNQDRYSGNDDRSDRNDRSDRRQRSQQDDDRMSSRSDERDQRRSMGREFAMLDENDDGIVTRSEYVANVSNPSNITVREARQLFDAAAGDDERLTRREFLNPSPEFERLSERFLPAQ